MAHISVIDDLFFLRNVSVDTESSAGLQTNETWLVCDSTAVHLHFYTTSSVHSFLSSRSSSSSARTNHWSSASQTLPLPFSRFYLLSFTSVFLLLHPPVFLPFFHIICLNHVINPYIFYSFIYLLHWPFAPLPMPVSVWVLCQPLCQDRSPATPASGGTERETGRAHCYCWTGVVLQLGNTVTWNYMNSFEVVASYDWQVWVCSFWTPMDLIDGGRVTRKSHSCEIINLKAQSA